MVEKETENYINPYLIKEWEKSRDIMTDLLDHLLNLRKYSFTFITALLSAESFLLPYLLKPELIEVPNTDGFWYLNPSNLPDMLKLAILLVNLLLILAVVVIDRNVTVIQYSAATRTRILERALNLEFTETTTKGYRGAKCEKWFTRLYSFFVVIILILGCFVLFPNFLLISILAVIGLITIRSIIEIRKPKVKYEHGPMDYTIDKLHCKIGDTIAITLTNLGRKTEIRLNPDDVLWVIKSENGKKPLKLEKQEMK